MANARALAATTPPPRTLYTRRDLHAPRSWIAVSAVARGPRVLKRYFRVELHRCCVGFDDGRGILGNSFVQACVLRRELNATWENAFRRPYAVVTDEVTLGYPASTRVSKLRHSGHSDQVQVSRRWRSRKRNAEPFVVRGAWVDVNRRRQVRIKHYECPNNCPSTMPRRPGAVRDRRNVDSNGRGIPITRYRVGRLTAAAAIRRVSGAC